MDSGPMPMQVAVRSGVGPWPLNGAASQFAHPRVLQYPVTNTPATLSPAPAGDAHNWRVFIA